LPRCPTASEASTTQSLHGLSPFTSTIATALPSHVRSTASVGNDGLSSAPRPVHPDEQRVANHVPRIAKTNVKNAWKWTTSNAALLTAIVAAIAIIPTVIQFRSSQRQFVQTSRNTRYNDIVTLLGSDSPTIQLNSIMRLVDFAQDGSNFGSRRAQIATGHEIYQTLAQFISSNTPNTGAELTAYSSQNAETKVALTAATQLAHLERSQLPGPWPIDLTHADLHGVSMDNLVLKTQVDWRGIDLREGTFNNIHVEQKVAPDLQDAFFTCVDMKGTPKEEATLGSANLDGADLQGADLSYLDLSHVQSLRPAQVAHTRFNDAAKWPPGFQIPAKNPWQDHRGRCTRIIAAMTGMLPGEGYADTVPWPVDARHLSPEEQEHLKIVRAARDSLSAMGD
jgi:uncharacterized protein YjbI with pentapeptide repeats